MHLVQGWSCDVTKDGCRTCSLNFFEICESELRGIVQDFVICENVTFLMSVEISLP